jgi:uncharacterized NAD-dependent epimerase/dehydratase family protein
MRKTAIVLAEGYFKTPNGKTVHGLVRGSERFEVLAVIDSTCAGEDAGAALDGIRRDIPIVASIDEALALPAAAAEFAVIGCATHGGRLTTPLRALVLESVQKNLHIANGLHDAVSDDTEIAAIARAKNLEIIDLRKPKPKSELHFWHGDIRHVKAPRIAVLGTDCALGKRTTTRMLTQALNAAGISAEMIYTGQTGWMQGCRYGFVFDATLNDFVSGELEHALVSCDKEVGPDIMIIEGQSSLRNPSGPCGSEFLLSGGARGVVLQHAPGREFFEGYDEIGYRIPPVSEEIELIRLLGARTLALTIQGEGLSEDSLKQAQLELQRELGIPVVRPLQEGLDALVPVVRQFIAEEAGK